MRSLPVHRLCPKRDHRLRITRIVLMVWPPFGRRSRRRVSMPSIVASWYNKEPFVDTAGITAQDEIRGMSSFFTALAR